MKKKIPASFVPFYSNVLIGSITDHFHYSCSAIFHF